VFVRRRSHGLVYCLSTSGDHPYLQAFCEAAGSGLSAAYCPVPARLQYGCSTRPSLGSCSLICGAFRFSLTLRSRLPPGQTLANCELTRCSLPLRCTLISLPRAVRFVLAAGGTSAPQHVLGSSQLRAAFK
jgi:hypothetical protein